MVIMRDVCVMLEYLSVREELLVNVCIFPDKPIFSVDIHPTGKRFATGGQGGDSGRVVVWNLNPVLFEAVEVDPNIPKMLCQMDNHLG